MSFRTTLNRQQQRQGQDNQGFSIWHGTLPQIAIALALFGYCLLFLTILGPCVPARLSQLCSEPAPPAFPTDRLFVEQSVEG